jgi:hypothetical protein
VYRERHLDLPIIATCPRGQQFEREKIGFSLDDIRAAIAEATP